LVNSSGYVEGVKFEDVDGIAEELRSRAFEIVRPREAISLREYYRGALRREELLDTKIQLPLECKYIKSIPQFCHPTNEKNIKQFDHHDPKLACHGDFDKGETCWYNWRDGFIIHTGPGAHPQEILHESSLMVKSALSYLNNKSTCAQGMK